MSNNKPDEDSLVVNPPVNMVPPESTIDPGLIQISQLIKEGFLEYKEKDIQAKKIDLEALNIEIKDRQILTGFIVGSILIIIIVIAYLTLEKQFEGSTFAFLLGTSVGSLFTILSKMFVLPRGEEE
jgi:hypothetical protein